MEWSFIYWGEKMSEDKTLRLIFGVVLVLLSFPLLIANLFMGFGAMTTGTCPMCGEEFSEMPMHGSAWGVGLWVVFFIALVLLLVLGIYLIVQGIK